MLTDNEKTVTDRHIAGIAVRNETMVAVSNYYGVTICTCVPYDPESKGGSESTVKVAKADLVPTEANLLNEYHTFAELEEACATAMATFNGRMHSVTRRIPTEALNEELAFSHRLPDDPYTAAFGESRGVGWSSVVSYRGARYSVPHAHCDTRVWVRTTGDEVIIVAGEGSGAKEGPAQDGAAWRILHLRRALPGTPREPRERRPRPTSRSEEQILALGEGAKRYLVEGAATDSAGLRAHISGRGGLFGRTAWCWPGRRGSGTRGHGRALLGGRSRVDPRARRWRTGSAQQFTRRALLGPGHLVVERLPRRQPLRPDRE